MFFYYLKLLCDLGKRHEKRKKKRNIILFTRAPVATTQLLITVISCRPAGVAMIRLTGKGRVISRAPSYYADDDVNILVLLFVYIVI